MFYVSRKFRGNLYGVTDSIDGIEERYSLEDLVKIVEQGVEIQGVSKNGVVTKVFSSIDDAYKSVLARLKLLSKGKIDFKYELDVFSITIDGDDIVLNGLNRDCPRNVTVPYGVTKIASYAFDACGNLNSVVIPETVTYLGDSCFGGCTSLEGINSSEYADLRRVTDLGERTFYHCSSLKGAILDYNMESIPSECFAGMYSVKRSLYKVYW